MEDEKAKRDNETLIAFWNEALALSDKEKEASKAYGREDYREMAPSLKLYEAAKSLGHAKKVLDYGCGNGWGAIIASRNGSPSVTAVDVIPSSIESAAFYASLFGADIHSFQIRPDWLKTVSPATYDGIFCSNVLDVLPLETSKEIVRELARVATADASVFIGLNYYLNPEKARERGLVLNEGKYLYVDGVLRLLSLSDEDWEAIFAPYFTVEKLEYFAWPNEKAETRRLFHLRKR